MFTMYGTAGHEFARLGIPVVNAGDNRHIAYDFNYHPRSVEEYSDLIARADRLTITPKPEDFAEYVYMNYHYFAERYSTGANPLPPSFYADVDYEALTTVPMGYDRLIHEHDARREAEMEQHFTSAICATICKVKASGLRIPIVRHFPRRAERPCGTRVADTSTAPFP